MTAIVDNTGRKVGDFLRERIEAGSDLSIVSAYFTIYAYGALRDVRWPRKIGQVAKVYSPV